MAFKTRANFETEAEEVARLAAAPQGSQNQKLSELPVLHMMIRRGMLIKVPETHCKEGDTVIVTPITEHPGGRVDGEKGQRHSSTWDCMVVGGNSATYTPGGWDIYLPAAALVRGEQVTI